MKKLILITIISLGLIGCTPYITHDVARVVEIKVEAGNICNFKVTGKNCSFWIYKCPCDKYKVGENPFKLDTL